MSGDDRDFVKLAWKRDSKGYELKQAETRILRKQRLTPANSKGVRTPIPAKSHSEPQRIVRCGGKLEATRPTAEDPKLYLKFMQVKTAEELCRFINAFGPLTEDAHSEVPGYEHVGKILECAKQMYDLSKVNISGGLAQRLPQGVVLDLADIRASLVVDRLSGELKLQFQTRNLLDALRLQFSRDRVANKLKQCVKCGGPFLAGIGEGRRGGALYCSSECQEAAKSKRAAKRRSQERTEP